MRVLLGSEATGNGSQVTTTVAPRLAVADTLLQRNKLVPVLHGLFLTPAQKGVDGRLGEAGGTVALGVYTDMDIGHGDILLELVLTVGIHQLQHHAHRAAQLLSRLVGLSHGDTDNDVGTHLTGHVGGVVVAQAPVDEHLVAQTHRGKDGGDGHRGTHGLRQATGMEIVFGIGDQISGHTGKRDGQAIEIDGIGIAGTQFL